MNRFRWLALATLVLVGGCGGGSGGVHSSSADAPATRGSDGTTAQTVTAVALSWRPSKESSVNSPGGGYAIYYSATPKLPIGDARVAKVEVPYVQGTSAPTATSIELAPGTYYFRIAAYSKPLAPSGHTAIRSALSAERSLTVPRT